MTHGPQTTPCQRQPVRAPCGRIIRPATAAGPGDGQSASPRFITCKRCLQLGKRGKFRLVWWWPKQLNLKWQQTLPGVEV